MWPLKTILYFGAFWVACAMSLLNPIWGLINYMIVYQTDPTATWWGLPLVDLGMRFSLLAAGFTMLGMIVARRRMPKIRSAFGWWELGVCAIFVIAAINTLTGLEYGPSARWNFEKLWKLLLFALILGRLAASRENLKLVLWTLVIGSLHIGYDAYTAPVGAFVLGRLENVGGPDFSTTSGAAAHLSAMLPLIGAVFLTTKHWRWKLVAGLSGALTVNAIIMCRTRSAFIGLVVGALIALLAAPRARRYRIHIFLIAGALTAFSLTDDHFWKRMGTLIDSQVMATDLATVSRQEIWVASLHILADYPLGIGVGNFPRVIGDYDERHYKRSTHNSVVVCFVELGIQGGVVFLSLFFGSLFLIYRCTRLAPGTRDPLETQILAYGMLISLVTYFVTALGTQRFYCESFWWVMILPLSLYRLTVAERAALVEVPEPVAGPMPENEGLTDRVLPYGI